MSSEDNLLFSQMDLHVDATFWGETENRKLNIWKLNTPTVDLSATIKNPLFSAGGYKVASSESSSSSATSATAAASGSSEADSNEAPLLVHNVTVDNRAYRGCHNEEVSALHPVLNHTFNKTPEAQAEPAQKVRDCCVRVDYFNCNTIEEYKQIMSTTSSKKRQLHFVESDLVKTVQSDKLGEIPLTRGYIISFADLKQHTFQFQTAFPVTDLPTFVAAKPAITKRTPIEALAKTPEFSSVVTKEWWSSLISHLGSLSETHSAWSGSPEVSENRLRILPFLVPWKNFSGSADSKNKMLPFTNAALADVNEGKLAIAMIDAGNSNPAYPSWVWRNLVTAIRIAHPQLKNFTLIAVRGGAEGLSSSSSSSGTTTVFDCKCEAIEDIKPALAGMTVAGWHKGVNTVDLSAQMDPVKLADSSANLNLTLMKWRMLPSLNLERLGRLKCLLLGSGTLGCNIARHLVMWGVRNITMVDRGNVSHSNPVRQTLFEHADALKTGEDRIKSVAAAAALRRILPTVDAKGINLEIQMPGHRIDEVALAEKTKEIEKLIELIKSHDVVFLLTDSRESRWLPTLLCKAHNIPCINAALAFDSYVVMRHGHFDQAPPVGCYFCNDVVAPIDSLSQRSLDQQCTVTRPGVSGIASALAVELLASILNHPRKFLCPAWIDEESPAFDEKIDSKEHECESVLGIIPHQLRGNISNSYACNVLHGRAYSKCTACSESVVNSYLKGGVEWLVKVINSPEELEKVSGLEADKKELEALGEDACDFDDDN